MAARNLGSTGRTPRDPSEVRRITRLAQAGNKVHGGYVVPHRNMSRLGRARDSVSWFLASLALMIGTRWYREMISGAIAIGLDTAIKQSKVADANPGKKD